MISSSLLKTCYIDMKFKSFYLLRCNEYYCTINIRRNHCSREYNKCFTRWQFFSWKFIFIRFNIKLEKLSSKQRLYLSLMKPGRISYWLAIDSSFIKAIIHYFSFIVLPVLYVWFLFIMFRIGVSFSLLSYEITNQYKQYGKFLKSGWLTILFPIWVLISIPSAIVLYRFIHSLIHYRSFPRHLIHVQWGRLLYIIGLLISFTFYYLIQTKDFMINPIFTLLPLCISCFLSIPLLSSRIHGLNQFVRKWHQQLQDENHSRLLIWKANMLKAQVIGEMILYSIITLLSISFYEISFQITLRFLFLFISFHQ